MKLKTHKGLRKRVKITGRGKIIFSKVSRRHLLINKSKRQKRSSPRGIVVHASDVVRVEKLLPNSF